MAASDPLDLAALLLKGAHDGHDPEVVRRCAVIAYRVELGLDDAPASLVVQVLVTELARAISVDPFAPAALLGAFRAAMHAVAKAVGGRADAFWQAGAPATWSMLAPLCADRAGEQLRAVAQEANSSMFRRALAALDSSPAGAGPTEAQLQWIMEGRDAFACQPAAARIAAMPRYARPDAETLEALGKAISHESVLSGSAAAGERAWRAMARRNPQEQGS
jgi:hypothetical protein